MNKFSLLKIVTILLMSWGTVDATAADIVYKYSYAGDFHDGLALVADNQGKYGYIDIQGKEVIPCQYESATTFSFGRAVVGTNGKKGIIGTDGTFICQPDMQAASPFTDGLSWVRNAAGQNGLVDVNGKFIPVAADEASAFSKGVATITGGYITKQGKSIPAKGWEVGWLYNDAGGDFGQSGFSCPLVNDGAILVRHLIDDYNFRDGFIDYTGRFIVKIGQYKNCSLNFSDGLLAVEINNKWGYVNKAGRLVIPCKYEEAAVKLNGKYGFIDKSGKLVIPCIYDGAYNSYKDGFNNGCCMAKKGGLWGLIDKAGKELSPFKYKLSDGQEWSEGVLQVKSQEGKIGYINNTGKEIIPCKYNDSGSFDLYSGVINKGECHDGMILVKDPESHKLGYFDKEGRQVTPFIFTEARPFSEGKAAVSVEFKQWGFIDKSGNSLF